MKKKFIAPLWWRKLKKFYIKNVEQSKYIKPKFILFWTVSIGCVFIPESIWNISMSNIEFPVILFVFGVTFLSKNK